MDTELSRLRWRCRRGMRELDTLLLDFLQCGYAELSSGDRARFAGLLEVQDPLLYAWLLGREEPADPGLCGLLERIRAYRAV